MDNNIDEFELKQSLKNVNVCDYPEEAFMYHSIFNMACKNGNDYADYYHILQHSPLDFLQDKIEDIIIYGQISVEDIPEVLLNNRNVAFLLTKKQLYTMDFLPFSYRDDEEFINEIAQIDGNILKYATSRIRNIDYIVQNAVATSSESLQYVPENKKTMTLCDFALFNNDQGHPEVWEYVPDNLKKEWYIKSIGKKVPEIYQYLDKSFHEDVNLTNHFLEFSNCLEFASKTIQDNEDCVDLACSTYQGNERWHNFKFASNRLKNDSDFSWKIIKNDPQLLFYCGDNIRNDANIALKIHSPNVLKTKNKKNLLSFFNEKVKENEAVGMAALKFDPSSATHLSHKLKTNKEFLFNYIEQEEYKGNNLQYFSIELRNDKDLMLKAIKQKESSLIYIAPELKFSKQFLNEVIANVDNDTFEKYMKLLDFKENEEIPFFHIIKKRFGDDSLNTMDNKFFLKLVTNNAFHVHLNSQPNIYEYLSNYELFDKLDTSVDNKNTQSKKKI